MEILKFDLEIQRCATLHIYEEISPEQVTGDSHDQLDDDGLNVKKIVELFRVTLDIVNDSPGKRKLFFRHCQLVPDGNCYLDKKTRFMNLDVPPTFEICTRLRLDRNIYWMPLGDAPSLMYNIHESSHYRGKPIEVGKRLFIIQVIDKNISLFEQEVWCTPDDKGECKIMGGYSIIPETEKSLEGQELTPALAFQVNRILDAGEENRGGEGFFKWPSTDAFASNNSNGVSVVDWPQEGMLKYKGYAVGKNGIPQLRRQEILEEVYLSPLPNVMDVDYMQEWGEAETSKRLRKIAESIASFTRNMKRKPFSEGLEAIEDWESDLAWLKEKFYNGIYDQIFSWPDSRLK